MNTTRRASKLAAVLGVIACSGAPTADHVAPPPPSVQGQFSIAGNYYSNSRGTLILTNVGSADSVSGQGSFGAYGDGRFTITAARHAGDASNAAWAGSIEPGAPPALNLRFTSQWQGRARGGLGGWFLRMSITYPGGTIGTINFYQ